MSFPAVWVGSRGGEGSGDGARRASAGHLASAHQLPRFDRCAVQRLQPTTQRSHRPDHTTVAEMVWYFLVSYCVGLRTGCSQDQLQYSQPPLPKRVTFDILSEPRFHFLGQSNIQLYRGPRTLKAHRLPGPTDFSWLYYMRFYWEPLAPTAGAPSKGCDLVIEVANMRFQYGQGEEEGAPGGGPCFLLFQQGHFPGKCFFWGGILISSK